YISPGELQEIFSISADKLGWMLASAKKDAVGAINFLKENDFPPLTFIIAEDIPGSIKPPASLKKSAPKDIAAAIGYILKDIKVENGIASKESCVISGGGTLPRRAGRLMGLEQDIKELSGQLASVESKIKDNEEILNKNYSKREKLSSQRDDLNRALVPARQKVDRLTGSLKYIESELESVKEKMDSIVSIEDIDKQRDETLKRIKETGSELSAKKTGISQKQKELNEISASAAELKVRRDSLRQLLDQSRSSLVNLTSRRDQLKGDIENLQESIKDAEAKKIRREKQHKKDMVNIKETEEIRRKSRGTIGEIENDKSQIVLELKKLKNSHKETEFKLEKLKENLNQQRSNVERLKERLKSIRVRMREDMGAEIEDALKDYSTEDIAEGDIIELKNKIERIGNVNMEAPEEFEKENERFEFIKDHVDDLEKSDRDIRSIISKINKQTKERFHDTFNRVNENFAEIFKKLFEGGHAKIMLVDPDNILESGIEINARPPGKKIKSISLTSGGEKALSAIALMFAIYEVRPTPFCILDEVDSPLDDNNLQRFLRMLKGYTDSTQFIIITHNKLTMEMCDTFYGVTMEEFGVTKIISVKLREAVKKATAPNKGHAEGSAISGATEGSAISGATEGSAISGATEGSAISGTQTGEAHLFLSG
ncbi:MAG: hypothetical protein U9R36_01990, partial [Elusimicrobiota bacterium]|nr:hypothetical protein [Elusimicrobiota bacterium]